MAERESHYEHFVKWRDERWPNVKKIGTPTDELAFCVSHYLSQFPGRIPPMLLEFIREKTMELNEHVALFLEMKNYYDVAHKASQNAHKAWRLAESEMIDAMLNGQVKTFKHLETGEVFGLSEHFGISVTHNNTDLIRNWLVENEGDDAPFLTEVCDKKAVTAHVKTLVEKNRAGGKADEDGVPEFLNLKTRPVLSHRNKNG